MLILAIDTATSAIGAALLAPGEEPVVRVEIDPRAHTERLAPLVRDALLSSGATPGDLTDVAVGTGPGPFTGLRVGMVTAVTMANALGIPVHGVCSLDVLAEEALAGGDVPEVLVATDARRREVYWARYARGGERSQVPGGVVALTAPAVDRPAELAVELRSLPTAGRGPLLYPDLFPAPLRGPLDVDPGWLARVVMSRISAGVAMPVVPLYLRRPDALTSAERRAQ